ncbi:MAG: aminoacyl-tRNA hydrolase [Pseudomonadota bacterium]
MFELVVGLGNPGPQYEQTRHNAGVWALRRIAEKYRLNFSLVSKFSAEIAQPTPGTHAPRLVFPLSYMNNSGQPVAAIANFYKIPANKILILHDELDVPPGNVRLKQGGGAGGHNGLKSLLQHLGQESNFSRIRIGIGHPGHRDRVLNYVLEKPSKEDRARIESGIDKLIHSLDLVLDSAPESWQRAMHQIHT